MGRPRDGARVVERAARFTLAIALRLQRRDIVRLARPPAWLLTVGMATMWLVSSLVARLAFGAPVRICLLIGAVVTPTDPVVAKLHRLGPLRPIASEGPAARHVVL